MTNWRGTSSWDDENTLELTVVMAAQPYDYTNTHKMVHFKRVPRMVCELQLNKAVKKF